MGKSKFHFRSFISFCLFITIAWLLITGTVLYIAPPGRIAHWQAWSIWGFDKDQWQAQHTIFSYVFIILSIIHIFTLNWKNLWSYVKLKSKNGFRKKYEFAGALLIALLLFLGTTLEIPPLSSFFEMGQDIGFMWEEKDTMAPAPHTENLSLREVVSQHSTVDLTESIDRLKKKNIVVDNPSQTLKEIALSNETSPSEIFEIILPAQNHAGKQSGKGYGRMTISELSKELGLTADEIIAKLEKNGMMASSSNTIRDVASKYNKHPSELMRIVRDKG